MSILLQVALRSEYEWFWIIIRVVCHLPAMIVEFQRLISPFL